MSRTKRILVLLIALAILIAAAPSVLAETQLDVAFADDFSGTMAEWVNPLLDNDPMTDDFGCGDWMIVNGALRQVDSTSSFPYLSPKDRIWKNFTMEMKFKFLVNVAGWFGVSVRKDSGAFDARFNGCNNVLIYVNSWGGVVAMRGTPGAGAPEQIATYEGDPITGLMDQYHTMKVVVQDTRYKVYVDNIVRLDFTYDMKAVNSAGYVSLNTCIQRVEIDDFKIAPLSAGTPTKAPTKAVTPSAAAATPTLEPTLEPTPEPTAEPTTEPTPPAATPTAAPTATRFPQDDGSPNIPLIAGLSLLTLAVLGGGTMLLLSRKKK